MGARSSRYAPALPSKAVVVTMEGKTEGEAATAEEILKKWPCHFICESDGIHVGFRIACKYIVKPRDPLKAGQLYFVLPQRMLNCVLDNSDLAALLARASSALLLLSPTKRAAPLLFSPPNQQQQQHHYDYEQDRYAAPLPMAAGPCKGKVLVGSTRKPWRHCRLETIEETL